MDKVLTQLDYTPQLATTGDFNSQSQDDNDNNRTKSSPTMDNDNNHMILMKCEFDTKASNA